VETRGTDHRFVIISYCWCLIVFPAPASRKLTGSYHSPKWKQAQDREGTWSRGAQRTVLSGFRRPSKILNSDWSGLPPEVGSSSRIVRNEIAPLHWHRYERMLSECTRRCSHRSVPFSPLGGRVRNPDSASRRPSPPSTQEPHWQADVLGAYPARARSPTNNHA